MPSKIKKTPEPTPAPARAKPEIRTWPGWRFASPIAIGLLAALLLLWNIDYKFLWQDEAATAVLATRMLKFGKPLAYDGVNLITTDVFNVADSATIGQRTTDAKTALDYFIRRGDIKPDYTWKWQPWGSFALCALSLKLLGPTTLAARLPFALAGIATVLLLYWLVLEFFESRLMAFLAALFLIFNCYWVLHARQCRYYSLSSLFLVLTVLTYLRWQQGRRWGAAFFILSSWLWFQCDYGTVWPVWLVLFADAFIAQRRTLWRPAIVAAILAATIAPFIYYYELWGRGSAAPDRLFSLQYNLVNINEYVAPLAAVAGALVLLVRRWKRLPEFERRLAAIACGIPVVLLFWVTWVAYSPFLRYVVMATPIGCLVGAWLIVRICRRYWELALTCALIWIVTTWFSLPLHPFLQPWQLYMSSAFVRPELKMLSHQVFRHPDDPNRGTVEWLRKNTAPSDEILINYEDIPLMFYLPNPIRGGMTAFRVEDDSKSPPRVLVIRKSVGFYHIPVFEREIQRYRWQRVQNDIPDMIWGNDPDPISLNVPPPTESLGIGRRLP